MLLAAVLYFAAIPTILAVQYQGKFDDNISKTDQALQAVARTSQSAIFTDPSISLTERQEQLKDAADKILSAQASLIELEQINQLAQLPAANLGNSYRAASVRHKQTRDMTRQSWQVLEQYSRTIQYLQSYTGAQASLQNSLDALNRIRDFNPLKGDSHGMSGIASLMNDHGIILRTQSPPNRFKPLHENMLTNLDRAKDNFTKLSNGLSAGQDEAIYQAVGQLETLTTQTDLHDKVLLVSLADKAPTLRQVAELPEKIEHARGL